MLLGRLFKGTFIYGFGQILSRTITFLLLPLYTAYLAPEDYGIFGSLAIIGMMMNGVFTLGFGGSLPRKYWALTSEGERETLIWSSYVILFLNCACWNLLAFIFSKQISLFLFEDAQYSSLVFLTFLGTSLTASLYPLLTYFRLKERAVLAISIYVNEVLMAVIATVYFVVGRGLGVEGLVLGGVCAQSCTCVLTLGLAFKMIPFGFRLKHLDELFKVGYPFIFGLFGYYILQASSRYFLNHFADLRAVGIFCMGLYFARPIEMAVGSFLTAWPPFFTPYLNQLDEAKATFGKVFSYYLIGMGVLLAPLFTLAQFLTHLMLQPAYWEASSVIGLIAFSQSLWGMYIVSVSPLTLFKQSWLQMCIELLAGTICVLANCLFIPMFGILGAAFGMLVGFLSVVLMGIAMGRRFLKIEYERKRICLVILGFLSVVGVSFIPLPFGVSYMILMCFSTLCFYAYLWIACLTADEKLQLLLKFKNYVKMKDLKIVKS